MPCTTLFLCADQWKKPRAPFASGGSFNSNNTCCTREELSARESYFLLNISQLQPLLNESQMPFTTLSFSVSVPP
uniref:Uncharacterized protein n=1 Tax=Rhizophora mucronata TaxID=61149 RepID=A0A2P2MXE1_RHIMU